MNPLDSGKRKNIREILKNRLTNIIYISKYKYCKGISLVSQTGRTQLYFEWSEKKQMGQMMYSEGSVERVSRRPANHYFFTSPFHKPQHFPSSDSLVTHNNKDNDNYNDINYHPITIPSFRLLLSSHVVCSRHRFLI